MTTKQLKGLVQRRNGAASTVALTVSSRGEISMPLSIAKSLAGAGEVAVAAELDKDTIVTFRAKVSSDGTLKRTPGSSAEVRKASISESPENSVGQDTSLRGIWRPVTNGGGFRSRPDLHQPMNSSGAIPRTGDDGSQNWDSARSMEVDLTAGKSDAHPVIQKAAEMIIRSSRGGK